MNSKPGDADEPNSELHPAVTNACPHPAVIAQGELGMLRFEDFGFFASQLWQHLRLPGLTRCQLDIADYLQHGPRRLMVMAFRGVGKSWLTAAYVLWLLYRNPQERILVISASKDRADGFTVFVRQLIGDVPWLKWLEPAKGRRDSVISFDVGPSEPHQSPSVKSAGITGQITGSRATRIVADDIEVPSNSLTNLLRERLAEQVKEFDAILVPGGQILYLGTPQTEMSLYKQLPQRGYEVRVWPARTPVAKKRADYGGLLAPMIERLCDELGEWKPTDPERFDDGDLLERETSYGRSGFALQFQLDQSLSDLERFPLKAADLMVVDDADRGYAELRWGRSTAGGGRTIINDLPCAGLTKDAFYRPMHQVVGTFGGRGPSPEFDQTLMFVDPSGSGSDETAWAVVRVCLGLFYIVRVGGAMDGFSQRTLDRISTDAKRFKVNEIRVEPNYGGGMFTEMLKAALRRGKYPCNVEDAEWSRGQKELRIIDTMEPLLNQHRVVILRSVIEDDLKAAQDYDVGIERRHAYQFIFQLTHLTRDKGSLAHEDRLEAVAGALAHFAHVAAADENQQRRDHEEALRSAELDKFMAEWDEMHGPTPASGNPDIQMRS